MDRKLDGGSLPHSRMTDSPGPPPRTSLNTRQPDVTPGTRLVIFAALVFPLALLPFVTLRRQVLGLHRKLDEVGTTTTTLHRELKTTLLELSVAREEHGRLRGLLEETRQSVEKMREDNYRNQLARVSKEKEIHGQIQELLASRNQTQLQVSHLRELGTSLADVAAFMREIEIQQGYVTQKQDGRGIERLRCLALQLGALGRAPDAETQAARPARGRASSTSAKSGSD